MAKGQNKVKGGNKELAIAIKKNYEAKMKPIEIAKLFNISKQKVNYWIHNPIIFHHKRRTKMTRKEINIIIKWARDRPVNLYSARKIQKKFNALPKNKKEKGEQKKVSLSTVNKTLNQYLSKPKPIRKVFYLDENKKEQRLKFLKFMKAHNISPSDIFFTDESIFNLSSYFNRNMKIRVSKRTEKGLKNGNESSIKLVTREFHKKVNGIMVSGGICRAGLGEIIFHSGNVNTFAYKQVLEYYKKDFEKLQPLFFQQDGARVHSSKGSRLEIQKLFGNKFIPTWEEKGNVIPKWPPNSPDLSPIELIWSIIKGMLNIFEPKDVNELKVAIKNIWDSIPAEICQRIIDYTKKRWDLCIKHRGRRLDKELLRKIESNQDSIKWKVKNSLINGVRVSYNDKFVLKLKKRDIKEKQRKLKDEIQKEKQAKDNLDRLLRLKPKEYKNISNQEKDETRFSYILQKTKRETLEKEIEQLQEMTAVEYLENLNPEIKEQLIGLCLSKKILEDDDDDSDNYSDDTEEMEE